MKKKRLIIILSVLIVSFFFRHNSYGQEVQNEESKFGLGSSFFYLNTHDMFRSRGSMNKVHMIFNVSSKFRLEPIIGFEIITPNEENYYLGIGFIGKKMIPDFNILYGVRLGLSEESSKSITASIGGEYFFIRNFSIGSEIQLRGLYFREEWIVSTNTPIFVRFYF